MNNARLPKAFFRREATTVAEELLGKYVVHRTNGRREASMITEVEVYDGPHDTASHAHRGCTKRNAPMFEEGGIWYVYLCYGIHEMLNIVTGPRRYPSAILIRGVTGYDGPGKLTRAFGIDRRYNGYTASYSTGLWIEDRGVIIPASHIQRTPRVGIAYAATPWKEAPYRFVVDRSFIGT